MGVQYSVTMNNARLDAEETAIGTSPQLRIYSGAKPANCAAAASGTLLATLTLPSDWMANASGAVKSKSGTWSGSASAAGTAGHYRIYDSAGTTCHEQGDVGTSGADMNFDNTVFASGQSITITGFQKPPAISDPMLLLKSTDILRVVTGAAANLTVHASHVDNASGVITPDRSNAAAISTATTTTIVGSPAGGAQRNVTAVAITNNHATASTQVTVQHYDGTNSEDLIGVTLLPGENLMLNEQGDWTHRDAQGAAYAYAGPPTANLGAAATLAETMPRETCPEVNTTAGASGTLFLQAIYLKAGTLVSNITVWSATTAAATGANLFFALYDGPTRALLAQSANQGAYTWAANSKKTLAMQTAYRVSVSGYYYIGVMQNATTIATLKGGTAKTGGQLAADAPIVHGTSSTGLTTALPNPAAAMTGGTASIYAAVS